MKPRVAATQPLVFRTEPPSGVRERQAPTRDAPTERHRPSARPFLARVPVLLAGIDELRLLQLDRSASFLVSLVDGVSSIDAILDQCLMPDDDALRILERLVGMGVIAFA